ncbi:MAG: C-GCAxxG-C-C family protein [Deltaproteobacteria bacterium]|nr:C-GCAxxG-C-C family protein [Deltaproteobacteria bacterium]
MNRVEETVDLHRNGGMTCSQALLTVYGEPYGIDPGKARLLGRTLAAGVARQGETCGYVTAALLILAHAQDDKNEAEARKKTHPVVMEFIRHFKERYGTTMCKELLGADMSAEEGLKKVMEEKLLAKRCHCDGGIGQNVAEILETLISIPE